jgi:hypothetical protein
MVTDSGSEGGTNMKCRGYLVIGLLFTGLLMVSGSVLASSCVDCHTDVDKLKAIAKTLPKKVGSAETAGKG